LGSNSRIKPLPNGDWEWSPPPGDLPFQSQWQQFRAARCVASTDRAGYIEANHSGNLRKNGVLEVSYSRYPLHCGACLKPIHFFEADTIIIGCQTQFKQHVRSEPFEGSTLHIYSWTVVHVKAKVAGCKECQGYMNRAAGKWGEGYIDVGSMVEQMALPPRKQE
jgi:hypothetical protein